MKKVMFDISLFTPTQWNTAEEKQRFAYHFVLFVESDFSFNKFPKWFYQRLSNCFGNIARYDINGFYQSWFSNYERKVDFIVNCLNYKCYGDPSFSYPDVEKELQNWLVENNILENLTNKLNEEIITRELIELKRLKLKYETKELVV